MVKEGPCRHEWLRRERGVGRQLKMTADHEKGKKTCFFEGKKTEEPRNRDNSRIRTFGHGCIKGDPGESSEFL